MKYRTGFVSNSSSPSFVIALMDLTPHKLQQIWDHQSEGQKMELMWTKTDPWSIQTTSTELRGSTSMGNFDMGKFLHRIGVPDAAITWDEFATWER